MALSFISELIGSYSLSGVISARKKGDLLSLTKQNDMFDGGSFFDIFFLKKVVRFFKMGFIKKKTSREAT